MKIRYRIENPRPPVCVICGQQVFGRVATILADASWYEGTKTKREVHTGDRAHEKHLPRELREEEKD